MGWLIAIIAILIIGGIILNKKLDLIKPQAKTKNEIPDFAGLYSRRQFIFANRNENEFYQHLLKNIPGGFAIFPKVRLADIVKGHKGASTKIRGIHVDYLICNNTYYNPCLIIELDGGSHNRPDRKARDFFVDGVCKAAKIPLLHISTDEMKTEKTIMDVAHALSKKPENPQRKHM